MKQKITHTSLVNVNVQCGMHRSLFLSNILNTHIHLHTYTTSQKGLKIYKKILLFKGISSAHKAGIYLIQSTEKISFDILITYSFVPLEKVELFWASLESGKWRLNL